MAGGVNTCGEIAVGGVSASSNTKDAECPLLLATATTATPQPSLLDVTPRLSPSDCSLVSSLVSVLVRLADLCWEGMHAGLD